MAPTMTAESQRLLRYTPGQSLRKKLYIVGLLLLVVGTAALMAALLLTPTAVLEEDDVASVDTELAKEPAPTPSKKTIAKPPTPRRPPQRAANLGVLHGVITSSSGQPIAAELVIAGQRISQPRRLRANSDGNYRVSNLPPGTVTVVVRAAGFRPQRVQGVEINGSTQRSFTLEPISGVLGKVVTPDGRPARGVWVRISHSGGGRTMRTDAEGRFSWDRPGVELASITAVAYSPWHGSSERRAPRDNEVLLLTLRDGASIEGKVVDSGGRPVADAAVAIERCKGEPDHDFGRRFWPPTRTNPQGEFRFVTARPGSCDLSADHPRHALTRVEGVWTSSANVTDNVLITLSDGGKVSGRVTIKASGAPLPGARVILFEPGSRLPPTVAMTDRDGQYVLTGIAPGRHSVRVTHKAYLTELRGGVDVPDGGEVQRDFALRKRKAGERFAFQGIGATLGRTKDGVIVRNTMPGSPAAKFGLKNGDLIVAVDQQPMANKGISNVVEKIRGKAGTPVTIEVRRPGQGLMSFTVERGDVVVKHPPAKGKR